MDHVQRFSLYQVFPVHILGARLGPGGPWVSLSLSLSRARARALRRCPTSVASHFLDLMKLLDFCRFWLMSDTDDGRLASSAWMSPRLSWSKPVATVRKIANPIRKPSRSGVSPYTLSAEV